MSEDGIARRAPSHAGQPYLQLWNLLEIACCTWPKRLTELARLSIVSEHSVGGGIVFPKTRREHKSGSVSFYTAWTTPEMQAAPPNGEGSDNKLSKRSHPAKPLVGAHDAAQV